MNVQPFSFTVHSRLINHTQHFFISISELNIVIFQESKINEELSELFTQLELVAGQDYFKKINIHTKETVDYYLTFETALIYLNSLNKTTPVIKNCIKQIAKLLTNLHTTRKKSSLNSEIKPLIDEFFSSKKYHYLLEEEDFYSLENMQEATEQLITLLFEVNRGTPITADGLALLFKNCLQPLRAIIERANETQSQLKMQIQQTEQAVTQQRVNA